MKNAGASMAKRFSAANWTTFALFAVLALTLIAFVAVPTRRVAVHRPPLVASGAIDDVEPAPRSDGRRVVRRGSSIIVRGWLLGHAGPDDVPWTLVDGRIAGAHGNYGIHDVTPPGQPSAAHRFTFILTIPTAALVSGNHDLSLWVHLESPRRVHQLGANIPFTVE